jgi:acetyl esterase/lipase
MERRTLLMLGAALPLGALAACGGEAPAREDEPVTTRTIAYGEDPSQFVELTEPSGTPRGTVVVIHGGFWRAAYDLSLGRPLAEDLARHGWVAVNIEYRRVGPASSGGGGGAPETFDDVRAAIELARRETGHETGHDIVVTLGHSAGGHLATWAGGRVEGVTHVVSQAGVLDLVAASEEKLGNLAVEDFLGHPATAPADLEVDPRQQLPLDVPVWCIHGRADTNVPISQSRTYVEAARAAGADAELVEVEGDHFVLIDTGSEAWAKTLEHLDGLS